MCEAHRALYVRHIRTHHYCYFLTHCCFHYETYIGISPYRTLDVDLAQCKVELCHV